MCVDEYIKKFKLFVIASDVGGSKRWQITKFISGLKSEIAKRLEMDIQFKPSISLKVIIKYALEYEKIVSIFEKLLVCKSKKNKSVEVIKAAEQQVQEKSKKEECQVETLPMKITFEDSYINQ